MGRRTTGTWALAGLLLVTALLYSRSLGFGFIEYDDPQRVRDNAIVAAGLTAAGFRWAWTTTAFAPYWHPLSWLSHMADCQIWGLDPRGHHLTNLLLHLGSVAALFLFLRTATGAAGRSLFAAGLFALHPFQVGTVAWIAGRPDLLSTFFALFALAAYSRYSRSRDGLSWTAVGACLALGLLGKPSVLTVPLLMLLLDDWPLGRLSPALGAFPDRKPLVRLLLEKTPWLALSVASAATVLLDKETVGGVGVAGQHVSLALRLGNASISLVRYLAKAVWPQGFSIHHPHPDLPGGHPWAAWEIAGAVLLLVAAATGVALSRRGYLRFGAAWYVVALLPVSGIAQIGNQAMADRYAYFGLIGPFVLAAWGAEALLGRWVPEEAWRVRVTRGLAVTVLAALAVVSSVELTPWRDSVSVFEHALAQYPDDPVMRYDLGVALEREGRGGEAERNYRRLLETRPGNGPAHINLGRLLYRRGRVEEAAAEFREALKADPASTLARNNLGSLLKETGHPAEAIREFEAALETDPAFSEARLNLASALRAAGRPADAAGEYRRVLAEHKDSADAANGLGLASAALGRWEDARQALETAVALRPDWPDALGDLAWALTAAPGREPGSGPGRAVDLASRAVQLTSGADARLLTILAEAHLHAGDVEKARSAARKAMSLTASDPRQRGLRERIALLLARLDSAGPGR